MFSPNSLNEIINCLNNSILNLQQIKQDLYMNNQEKIFQFLCDLSFELQNIINLIKNLNPNENYNKEAIQNLKNQIFCLENQLLNSNNKINDLNLLICEKECTIHNLLNAKKNIICPFCNNNLYKLNTNFESTTFETKSSFNNKNLGNLSYDDNKKVFSNKINLKNFPKRKNLSFDNNKSFIYTNDILEKTSNILNKTNQIKYYNLQSPLKKYSSLSPIQNIKKIYFSRSSENKNKKNTLMNDYLNNIRNQNSIPSKKYSLIESNDNNELLNNTFNRKYLLHNLNKNKSNIDLTNENKNKNKYKIENNKIVHDIINKNNCTFNFQKINFDNKKNKSSGKPKIDIKNVNKNKKSEPKNQLNSMVKKNEDMNKIKNEYVFQLDDSDIEINSKKNNNTYNNNTVQNNTHNNNIIKNINNNSFNNNSIDNKENLKIKEKNVFQKNLNPNTIKKSNNLNNKNLISNNLRLNDINERNKNKVNTKNIKDKINRVENIIKNIFKNKNTINYLKEKMGDNFLNIITNGDFTEDYLIKVEKYLKEENEGKKINLKKNNSLNLNEKKFKDPVINAIYNKEKLKNEIKNNQYNYKEFPRGWISSKEYFDNNIQNEKTEKSNLKIPNFP